MHSFEVTILGSSSATPTSTRNPSAQVVNVNEKLFLVDCGEAAQIQLRRFKVRIQRIENIFITHLHGDHYLGLVGLLGTMHLLGRDKPLNIYAPEGLQEIVDIQHKYSDTHLRFELVFHMLDTTEHRKVFDSKDVEVFTLPMVHRVPCCGFLFREKPRPRNILEDKLKEFRIPFSEIGTIRQGSDYIAPDGKIIPNSEITSAPHPQRTYACCSDTLYNENIIPWITGADLLYHEATFAEDKSDRAKETNHCTARQAATIALKARVKKLIIGHYSARYSDLQPLFEEAKAVFPQTVLAVEGESHRVGVDEALK